MKLQSLLRSSFILSIMLAGFASCKKDKAAEKKPTADFTYTSSNGAVLPISIATTNTSTGSGNTYVWSYQNGSSTETNPALSFTAGGKYNVKLVATNSFGSDSIIKEIKISPYAQTYTTLNGAVLNLFAWEGEKVMILSRDGNLNRATMYKWLKAIDTAYGYDKLCTGADPTILARTYLNKRSVIADVPLTCSPGGCGNVGVTGVEIQNSFFDIGYNAIQNNNQYDQTAFFEQSRNFWIYGDKLAYKTNDPVANGFAVFMRFMSMDAAGVNGAPYLSLTFPAFRQLVENQVNAYLADPSLNWGNTLALNKGVPNSGLEASDLFASFCFSLRNNYGGDTFVKNIWKQAALRPNATTTQDAVDNFFLAACAAANKNLTTVFQNWRWTISASATAAATKYP